MTKNELIKALENFDGDDVVILMDSDGLGWTNIGEVKKDGACIAILEDNTRPFSSDN
jgi:hypothetical protein